MLTVNAGCHGNSWRGTFLIVSVAITNLPCPQFVSLFEKMVSDLVSGHLGSEAYTRN